MPTRDELEAIEARRKLQKGMDAAVPPDLMRDILADSRRHSPMIPSSAMPANPAQVAKPSPSVENGWVKERPLTNEPSFAERQMAVAFPAQGRRGF